MFHLDAWVFRYEQCKIGAFSENKNALENAKIQTGKKNARAGLRQPAASQEDLARVSAECVRVQQ